NSSTRFTSPRAPAVINGRGAADERRRRRAPLPLVAPVIRICLSFTAMPAGEGTGSTFRCYRQRGMRTVRVLRNKESEERKSGNANAGHPDRHEKPRAELTGA